jgi:hypothetical protein
MNYLTTIKEHLNLLWLSRNCTKLSGAKFVTCYLEVFQREGSDENPRENDVNGICIRCPTVSRAQDERNSDFFFAMDLWPMKPEMFYITFDCCI